jgi:hypothetical protein
MQHAHVPLASVQNVLWPLHHARRMAEIVRAMAQEIERLDEDNAQLRAAVKMYREVVKALERPPSQH